ncbi:MAG: hypothetical protein R6U96_06045 [Promethearchaeia archaeon]
MARVDHHGAFAFLIYYSIWLLFYSEGTFILPRHLVFLIVIFGVFPDFDALYYIVKQRGEGKINTQFQHHLMFWTHWPVSYIPLIIIFVISTFFNFYSEYFLTPMIGIYCGHLLFDSISCGDGIMWGKLPWKKDQYSPFINLCKGGTDGYHGVYWEARYRDTLICKLGNIAVIIAIFIISTFQIITIVHYLPDPNSPGISGYYLSPVIFFIIGLVHGLREIPEKYLEEPPRGRYADYRINPKYINGLNKKNRQKHIKKYKSLLQENHLLKKLQKDEKTKG